MNLYRVLSWRVGSAPIENHLDISLVSDPVITVTGAESKGPAMETRLETIAPNRRYRLFVKPKSTATPVRSILTIMTMTAGSVHPEAHMVYAQVR